MLWYLSVCFDWLCRLTASTFKSESWNKSDFSQNNRINWYSAIAFFFIPYYPQLKSRGKYLSQNISRLRYSPLAEGECPKGKGLIAHPGLPQREEKERIRPLTLPPSGTSLYQKGRELSHDMSHRDNTLLTVDVNLRTETNHTLAQVPQGRNYPQSRELDKKIIRRRPVWDGI
jgi:hypothetical protein